MITVHQTTNAPGDNGINRRLSRRNNFIPATSTVVPLANAVNNHVVPITSPVILNEKATIFNEQTTSPIQKDTQVSNLENRIKDLENKLTNIQASIESSAQKTTAQSSRFRRR